MVCKSCSRGADTPCPEGGLARRTRAGSSRPGPFASSDGDTSCQNQARVSAPGARGCGALPAGAEGAAGACGAICTVIRFFASAPGGLTRLAENSGKGGGSAQAAPMPSVAASTATPIMRLIFRLLLDARFSLQTLWHNPYRKAISFRIWDQLA